MKKCSHYILLIFVLLLTLCGCESGAETGPIPSPSAVESAVPATEPSPELSRREKDWLEDFTFLKQQYAQYHPDPFYFCTEEEFNWKFDRLAEKMPQLTDSDICFELSAIMAGMGDTHTAVLPPDSFYDGAFPVMVLFFGDRLYLCGYLAEHEQFQPYLLREIVGVNGVDITYLRKKLESIVAPTNSWLSKEYMSNWFLPAFFDWAGCGHQKGYTFQILNENQEVEAVDIPVIPYQDYIAACSNTEMVYSEGLYAIHYLSRGNWAQYFQAETGDYIYLFFSEMDAVSDTLLQKMVQEPFEQTAELLRAHPGCSKLVIDLRAHRGGRLAALEYVRQYAQLLKTGTIEHTYIITGGCTQSAAIECTAILKEELGAVTVGEPTGQFTSFFMYDYAPAVVLPHSRIRVEISTGWWDGTPLTEVRYDENGKLYPWENTILPDVYVPQDIDDVRQGKDSVLEWVLAQ